MLCVIISLYKISLHVTQFNYSVLSFTNCVGKKLANLCSNILWPEVEWKMFANLCSYLLWPEVDWRNALMFDDNKEERYDESENKCADPSNNIPSPPYPLCCEI